MSSQLHPNRIVANFLRYAEDAKIILLHPNSRLRSLLVAQLVTDPQIRSFYHALDIDDRNMHDFLVHITHGLSKQHPTFGRHLSQLRSAVLREPGKHLDTILKAFLAEIDELEDETFYLILDEFDRTDLADEIQQFIDRLAHQLPLRCKLVLNSRTLPRLPWLSMIAEGHAVMLRDDVLVCENFYNIQNVTDAPLKALSIGPGYVFLDDRLVDDWEGHLPRLMLFYALDRPLITRNEICRSFWPDLDMDSAINVFHVTKRRLHKALDIDMLVHQGAYYRVNPAISLYSDTFEFVFLLMRGRHDDPANPLEHWQRVAKLYRGPFLQGHSDAWIQARRHAYRVAYIEALENIAQLWDEQGKHELALHTLLRAVDTDNANEAIHLKLLALYARLGRRAEAVAHYRSMENWARRSRASLSESVRRLYSEIIA